MASSKELDIQNFGCRLNALEGDQIRAAAEAAGLGDATIINSCAVTQEAVRQARQAVRKAKRNAPERPVFVTGCAAQTDPKEFEAMPEVSRIIGNVEKAQVAAYIPNAPDKMISDIMRDLPAIEAAGPAQPRQRAFVQVQNGCDHRCTFCIIPFGRGNSRSLPVERVIDQCRTLLDQGHGEIVLTGVDITSWGPDIGEAGIGVLIRKLLDALPNLNRLRLSSVDAVELDPEFLDLVVHEPRLMPHLHLSLQAGDNMILKRMKRRHSREEAVRFCQELKAKRPDIVFGADLIAGFPTETDEMFLNTLNLIEDCDLVWLHIFPFSARPDTPAAKMPQLNGAIVQQRARELREAGDRNRQKWLDQQKGKTFSVLMEKPDQGRAENFARIQLGTSAEAGAKTNIDTGVEAGQVVSVRVSENDGQKLFGERV
jgi:threonylcarbamoyladenosine tRNA methylthiotransferase MtaB